MIPVYIYWLALVILFGIAEAATLGLTSIWFAVGALAAMIAAICHASLLVQIIRNLRKNREHTGLMEPKNDRVLKLIRYMDAHLAEDISIDALAEHVYLSKYHMMRLFRKETGITVHDYLTQRRLLLARDHIRAGLSATDACYRSGWRSYSSFTRAYAKQFGTTPTGRRDASTRQEETYE